MLAVLAATAARAEVPEVLDHIPAQTRVAIIVPSLARLSGQVAMLNRQLGLNQPQMADVLALAKVMTGMMAGLDDQRGAALVLTSVPVPPRGSEAPAAAPQGVLLLPVRDHAAFLANYNAQPAAGEVQAVSILGRTVHVRALDGYAAIGTDRQQVASLAPAGAGGQLAARAGRFGRHLLGRADIVVYADLARLGPELLPVLDEQLAGLTASAPALAGVEGPAASALEAYVALYQRWTTCLLRDGDLILEGLDLDNGGAGFTLVLKFKADSEPGALLKELPEQSTSLDRLPGRPYLVASSVDAGALPLGSWLGELVAALGPDAAWARVFEQARELLDLSDGQWQSVVAADAGSAPGPGGVGGSYVVATSDPAAWIGAYRGMLAALDGVALGPLVYRTRFEPAAGALGGREVGRFEIGIEAPEPLRARLGDGAAALQTQRGLLWAVDGAVVLALNQELATLDAASAVASSAGGAASLDQDAGIADVRRRLPGRRVGEAYMNVGAIVQLAGGLAGAKLAGGPTMPADLPPVGVAATTGDGSIAIRGYLPMPVLTAIKDMVSGAMAAVPAGRVAAAGSAQAAP